MCDDFRNYSSNAHQDCSEDSPTKGFNYLDLHSRSQVCIKLDHFLTCNVSDTISAICITFKLGMMVDLCMAYIYVHAHVEDLELDLDF